MRAEGFFCSLGVLYGGLGISKLQFLIKKIKLKISSRNFFSILGHQTLDPDPESGSAIRKNAGSRSVAGSALNHCGPATLISSSVETGKSLVYADSRIDFFGINAQPSQIDLTFCPWLLLLKF